MLLLGLIGLIQTIFLPGLLLLYFAGIKTQSTIQKYVYIFALSLFANYSIVTILVSFKVYFQSVMFAFIIIEVLVLIFLLSTKRITFEYNLSFNNVFQSFKTLLNQNVFVLRFLLMGALIVSLFYFALLVANIGSIFYFVDTVNNIHWNTWAMDFANNLFPKTIFTFSTIDPF